MDNLKQLLQLSAKLYQLLETVPKGDERDKYIEEVNELLDERGGFVEELGAKDVRLDASNQLHAMLMDLDKGILERLDVVMRAVKEDMKSLQVAKKNEKQYSNPYSSVRVMDGMYYDKKK